MSLVRPAADPALVSNEELVTALCGPADRAEQARLFNACFKKRLDGRALAWRYDENPHGSSVSAVTRPPLHGDPERGLGEAVSGYACSPRLALAHGDPASAAPVGETGDVMTHPDWRKRGIFSALDRACMEETARRGWPAVFGLPNRRSAHIFLKLGWDRVGTVRPWTHLLRGGAAARRERFKAGRLAAWLTPLGVRRGRRARAALRRAAQAGGGFEAARIERFPPEVEALSRAVEARHAFMVRRDAAYLDWRFLDNPSRLHWATGVRDRAGAFRGYAVVQLPAGEGGPGYLVDVLAADAPAEAAAIDAGLAVLDVAGVDVVLATAITGSPWEALLRRAGFLPPRRESELIVIRQAHDPEHPLARAMTDASGWWFTDGDRDDETMG